MKITNEILSSVQSANNKTDALKVLSKHPNFDNLQKTTFKNILEYCFNSYLNGGEYNQKRNDAIQAGIRVKNSIDHEAFKDEDYIRTFDDIRDGIVCVMEQDPNYVNARSQSKTSRPFKQLKYNNVTSIQLHRIKNKIEEMGPYHGIDVSVYRTKNKEGAMINVYAFED